MNRYFKPERVHYIPKGAARIAHKASSAVVYVSDTAGRCYAMGFCGKRQKPDFNYRYSSPQKRADAIARYFEGVATAEARQAKRHADRTAWVCDYKPGEIVGTCWGYDQTNREYYEIVAVSGKKVSLRQVATAGWSTGHMTGNAAPLPGDYVGEAFSRIAGERGIKISSVAYATRTAFELVAGVKIYRAGSWSAYA